MSLKLKTVACKNFLHFGQWSEIQFDESRKIISIIGEWYDEPGRSNRSGKSSFAEIFCYAFYGKSRAKKEIDLINKNSEEGMLTKVVLVDEDTNEEIIIQRGRDQDGIPILELSNFEGADKKVVQAEINRIIGMSYDDFVMTSFFLQGDIHTFMEAGTTNQRNTITKWLEKAYWKEYEGRAKDVISNIEKKIVQLDYVIDQRPDLDRDKEIKERINLLEGQREALELNLNALNNDLVDVEGQLNKASDLSVLKTDLKILEKDVKNLVNDLSNFNKDISSLQDERVEAEKRQKDIEGLQELFDKKVNMRVEIESAKLNSEKATSEYAKLSHELESAESFLSDLKEFDNICPVMHKPCVAIEAVTGTKDEVEEKVLALRQKTKDAKVNKTEAQKASKKLQDSYNILISRIRVVESFKEFPSPEDIDNKIELIQSKKSSKTELIKEKRRLISEKKTAIAEYESVDFESLKKQKNEIKEKISDNKSESIDIIRSVAKLKGEIDQLRSKRIAASKAEKDKLIHIEDMNIHKYVAYMFSKNGIPSHQIEAAFEEIEEEANLILEKLYSDISVEFLSDKETIVWETNCLVCDYGYPKNYRKTECPNCGNERQKKRRDDLYIVIKTKNEQLDFNLESGGGKVLISLAIRLAFVRLLQRRIGVNFKVIVLDEIFGMLDEVNRNYVFKLLTTSLIQDFGFELVLAISHESEIRDAIPDVIKVTRYEEYSIFEWG